MKIFARVLFMVLCVTGLCVAQDAPTPEQAIQKIKELSTKELWPGFDPSSYPVAFYDGENTFLFNYPGVPEGFKETGKKGWLIFPGRHEMMSANTSVKLDGVGTATVMLNTLEESSMSLTSTAGVTIHELFHVFEREQGAAFFANEAVLFSYPFSDEEVLNLRLQENEAMRRALQASDDASRDGWTMRAIAVRMARARIMNTSHITYERMQELNEGMARYVQDLSTGVDPLKRFPDGGWSTDAIRLRAYSTGEFWAFQLDRYLPRWKELFNAGGKVTLDILLYVAFLQKEIKSLDFTAEELITFKHSAAERAEDYHALLKEEKANFEQLNGWRITFEVEEGANLLSLGHFDPINILNLGDGMVLHTRMLQLDNDNGGFKVLNHESLSYGPNDRPLHDGARWVTVAGFEEKPAIAEGDDHISINTDTLQIDLKNVAVTFDGERSILVLLKAMAQ